MRAVVAIVLSVLLLGLTVISIRMQMKREYQEPHPSVTSLEAEIPRINYLEQTRDIRRNVERQPRIKVIRHNEKNRSHYIEGEVVLRFSTRPDPATLERLLKQADGYVKREFDHAMIVKSRSKNTRELMKLFAEHPDSVYAEPNYVLLPNRVPNDELYRRYQWNLPTARMEQAWEVSQGRADVVVAVVDTGIDLTHPDLRDQLVPGYNVIEDNDHPQDDNGHGTHVAGIIAAATDNGIGIAGMAWNCKLMPIKAIGADGSGTAYDIAQGIYWATDHGASVINLSVGNYTPSAALREACRYAFERNVVLVAATGNEATDQPGYPAAYPEVLGVSAVDHTKRIADFSNFGDYVDVVAPGVDVPSTYIYNDYAALSGTSMACPHVAALAGLIRSVQPDMPNTRVMQLIRETATDLGTAGRDSRYGYGLINGAVALQKAAGIVEQRDVDPFGGWFQKFLRRLGL